MAEIIDARVRQKVDTAAGWATNPLIILDGEQAFVVDSLGQPVNFKIGDGTKTFADLPYWIDYAANLIIPTVAPGALPEPEEPGKMILLNAGTYTQTTGGNIVAPANAFNVAYWDGTTWTLAISIVISYDLSAYALKTDVEVEIIDNVTTWGQKAASGSTVARPANQTLIMGLPAPVAGRATKINMWGLGTGSIDFVILTKDPSTPAFTFVKKITKTVAVGENQFTLATGDLDTLTTYYLAAFSTSAIVPYVAAGAGAGWFVSAGGGQITALNSPVTATTSTSQLQVLVTIEQISVEPVNTKVVELNDRVGVNEVDIDFLLTQNTEVQSDITTLNDAVQVTTPKTYGRSSVVTGSATSAGRTLFDNGLKVTLPNTKLGDVQVYITVTGILKIKRVRANVSDPTKFDLISESGVPQEVSYTIPGGATIPGIITIPQAALTSLTFQVDDYIGICKLTGGLVYQAISGNGAISYSLNGGDLVGTANVASAASNLCAMAKVATYTSVPLKETVATLSGSINNNSKYAFRHTESTILDSENFFGATIPASWVIAGLWTFINGGLQTPALAGYAVNARYDKFSGLTRKSRHDRFLLNNLNAVFGFSYTPMEAQNGTVAVVDCVANTISLNYWTGTGATTTPVTVALTAGFLVAGRRYDTYFKRNRFYHEFIIADTLTGVSKTVSVDNYLGVGPTNVGRQWGKPGYLFIAGSGSANDVTFELMDYEAPCKPDIDVLLLGDSNLEGPVLGVNYQSAWGFQLEAYLGLTRCMVAARGGDETTNCLLRLDVDLLKFHPRKVIIALGTNDTDATVWKNNMLIIIQKCLDQGAIVELCTLPPRTGDSVKTAAINTMIRNYELGNYFYYDFSKLVTLNNDGVTNNPAYMESDQIHYNLAGQNLIAAYVKRVGTF